MQGAVSLTIFVVFLLLLLGIAIYGLAKMVMRDTKNYDAEYIWDPNNSEPFKELEKKHNA